MTRPELLPVVRVKGKKKRSNRVKTLRKLRAIQRVHAASLREFDPRAWEAALEEQASRMGLDKQEPDPFREGPGSTTTPVESRGNGRYAKSA